MRDNTMRIYSFVDFRKALRRANNAQRAFSKATFRSEVQIARGELYRIGRDDFFREDTNRSHDSLFDKYLKTYFFIYTLEI